MRETSAEVCRQNRTTHGFSKTPHYRVWTKMMRRCNNPNTVHYKWYGGRGIRVCERWHDYTNFLADMGPRPSDKHTIDRINVNGDYEPSNCRWATMSEQVLNRRSSRYLTLHGETKTLAEWGRLLDVKQPTIQQRLKRGWSVEDALTQPLHRHSR